MWWIVLLLIALAGQAIAEPGEVLIARQTIAAQAVITAEDLAFARRNAPGALTAIDEAVGQAARMTIYADRPIRASDLVRPAVVERNQIVVLTYRRGPLTITAEGRALARGAVGDTVRVINTASHGTISAKIAADGTLNVLP